MKIEIGWRQQIAGVVAPNAAPALATDGIETNPHKQASVLFRYTPVAASTFRGLVWVYRNGLWGAVLDSEWMSPTANFNYSITGDVPIAYPDRVYLQVTAITAGSLDLWAGPIINS